MKDEFSTAIYDIATKESQFVAKERELIEEAIEHTDESLLELTMQWFYFLNQLKVLERQKLQYFQDKLTLEKRLRKDAEEILRFSSHLYFESNKSISIKQIPNNNTQFSRWEKALRDNSLNTFFADLDYGDFQLKEAFRIENNIKLTEFEDKLAKWENSVLKGLFSVIEWQQVPHMIVYGISDKKTSENYDENILRIPKRIIEEWKLPDIVKPILSKSTDFELPFNTSIYSTSRILKEVLTQGEVKIGNWIYLLLSRAIVTNNSSKSDGDEKGIKGNMIKSKRSRAQSAKKRTEEDAKSEKTLSSSKHAFKDNKKTESDDEQEEWNCTYNSKEGIYLHYTYDTIYPEYILVIEPIPKDIVDSTKSIAANKNSQVGDSGVQFIRRLNSNGQTPTDGDTNSQTTDMSSVKVEMSSDIFSEDTYFKLYTTYMNMQINEIKDKIEDIKTKIKSIINSFWKKIVNFWIFFNLVSRKFS